jgi:hypothetical protein
VLVLPAAQSSSSTVLNSHSCVRIVIAITTAGWRPADYQMAGMILAHRR